MTRSWIQNFMIAIIESTESLAILQKIRQIALHDIVKMDRYSCGGICNVHVLCIITRSWIQNFRSAITESTESLEILQKTRQIALHDIVIMDRYLCGGFCNVHAPLQPALEYKT